ncbi:MAG: phosphatidylserine decarboxylase [Bacteroidaceae bacterium]|nr:phosphatidylserine decarboxylase [Bacteroidaceae bacterium]
MKELHAIFSVFCLLAAITSCTNDNTPAESEQQHTEAVSELMRLLDGNAEVKRLLEKSIAQAAAINPDRRYNPAQSLTEFYDFVDWNIRQLPWDVMIHQAPSDYGQSLYGRTDQGVGYFWFLVDQPLEELEGRGYYYPTVEFVEPFASWLTTYANSWGSWLSTEDSWNDTYYNMVANDPDWGLQNRWYGEGNQWRTFNDFFSRRLASPDMRPVSDVEVVAPGDSWPKSPYENDVTSTWHIGDDNQLEYPADLQIKTAKISDIAQLIGEDSQYKEAFAGGTLTHTFLDVNDYHRYHSPVSGTLRELRHIPGVAAGGGYTLWDDDEKLYYYHNNIGFQMVETRSCAIIETEDYGVVAMMPIGMSQICSCNWIESLHVGQQLSRGDEMGYFLFGGSDIVMLFQKDIQVEIVHSGGHLLMGEPYAKLMKKAEGHFAASLRQN